MPLAYSPDVAARICKALGVPGHCVSLTIRLKVGELVSVESVHYMPREMAESLADDFEAHKYVLVERMDDQKEAT